MNAVFSWDLDLGKSNNTINCDPLKYRTISSMYMDPDRNESNVIMYDININSCSIFML